MSPDRPPVQFVTNSSVRSDVLSVISGGDRTTEDVHTELDVSESAVYNALTELERTGLVERNVDAWSATGIGILVADYVRHRKRLEALLEDEQAYWENRDVEVIPERFRWNLPAVGAYELVRSTETDLNRVIREVVTRVSSVDAVDVISPIYHEAYEASMPDTDRSRLLLDSKVVDEVLATLDGPDYPNPFERTPVRVVDVEFALAVSEDWIILTLPSRSDGWAKVTLVSEATTAVDWGGQLFDHYWERAVPMETHLEE